MINWLKKIFDRKQPIQWRTEDSIFQYISDHLDENQRLPESSHDLPDQRMDENDDNKIRFAPGFMDTLFGAQDSDDSKIRINQLSKLIDRIAKYGDDVCQLEFYENIVSNNSAIDIIDAFLEEMVKRSLPIEPHLYNFAKDLTFKTTHRNSVKFGIAILGLCQKPSVIEDIKTIGLHDEFTVFSTVAILNLSNNPANDLWQLAKKVDGWGKIQLVDRLVKMELTEQQREWLVLEGYKNSIMYEYLAYACAVYGQLHIRLSETQIVDKLFTAAGEIIESLIMGGPAEDMRDYEHAAVTVEQYINHAQTHAEKIAHFIVLTRIHDFLTEIDLEAHQKNGWTEEIVTRCLADITPMLNNPIWEQRTHEALQSEDHLVYWNGKQAAAKLNIDIWQIVWQRLMANPLDFGCWFDVIRLAKPEHAEQIIGFGIKELPLNELATGPKDSLGLGTKFTQYQCLDSLTTFLEDHPKKGEKVIIAALNCPVTRNRNVAIKVLDKWTRENWSESIKNQLEKLKEIEPNEDSKANVRRLLNGEELVYN